MLIDCFYYLDDLTLVRARAPFYHICAAAPWITFASLPKFPCQVARGRPGGLETPFSALQHSR